MAYKVIILYQLYMPSYFLGTFTEYSPSELGTSIRASSRLGSSMIYEPAYVERCATIVLLDFLFKKLSVFLAFRTRDSNRIKHFVSDTSCICFTMEKTKIEKINKCIMIFY